jgi:aminomethyltransferase
MCNRDGGIKDDILVFRLEEKNYLLVYNAGNRTKDFDWLKENCRGDVTLSDISDTVAMFAVQGPNSAKLLSTISERPVEPIARFGISWTKLNGIRALISRTGYTGEDGFEVYAWDSTIANPENAQTVWNAILRAGIVYGIEPCGLGARDLLRLEAGLCLYGNDIDETKNPVEAKLTFVVKFQKDFIGKLSLLRVREAGAASIRVGLTTLTRAIPRHGFEVVDAGRTAGVITSGSFSPTVKRGIAMGYVEREVAQDGKIVEIKIRDRLEKARIVKPPFYDAHEYGFSRKSYSAPT